MRVHHIGYLVKDIYNSIKEFEKLGYVKKSNIVRDTIRYIDICFMENDGYIIELVSPYSDLSTVSNLIKKFKNMPYHICYKTNDIENALTELSRDGYIVINERCIAPALDNKNVVFLLGKDTGIIELLEE